MRISVCQASKTAIIALLLGLSQVCLAAYVNLDPPFIVNLAGNDGIKFVQVSAQVRVANPEAAQALTDHNPAIRDAMIMLISTKTPEQMSSRQGKEDLRQQALVAIRKVLETQHVDLPAVVEEKSAQDKTAENKDAEGEAKKAAAPESAIQDVYFTRFIIQ